MKIIMLTGGNSCGKTTTLNLVYNAINPTGKTLSVDNPKDFDCVITYQSKEIAFFTTGDYVRLLVAGIQQYNKQSNIVVLICACNDKILRSQSIQKKIIPNYEIVYIKKTKEPNKSKRQIQNQAKADEIIAQLNTLLK